MAASDVALSGDQRQESPPSRGSRGGGLRALAPEAGAGALTATVCAWGLTTPGPWRDEAVTLDVASRPLGGILALARDVDLVHLAYYLVVHVTLRLTDPGRHALTVTRVLSLLAVAGTAVLLVRLGRALGSVRVGTGAALLLAASPTASRYAQEARSYAMVTAAATAATLALVRALRTPSTRRWARYGLLLGTTGLLNVLALLIVPVHAVVVGVLTPRAPGAASRRRLLPPGPPVRRWALAVALSCTALAPLLYATLGQRGQVAWLGRPGIPQLLGILDTFWSPRALVVALVPVLFLAPRLGAHRTALALGTTWAVLPPLLLWTFSQWHPFFDRRYLVVAVPGAALAVASLATCRTPRRAASVWRPVPVVVPAAVLALASLPAHAACRGPVGHVEDVRGTAAALRVSARPGDAVLFSPNGLRVVVRAFPEAGRGLRDVALAGSPEASATVTGTEIAPSRVREALAGSERVWVVTGRRGLGESEDPTDVAKAGVLAAEFRLERTVTTGSFPVHLYVRSGTARAEPAAATGG